MTTTTEARVAPRPTYEVPATLRQAIAEGIDITALDADTIGYLASGTMSAETMKRDAVLYHHIVTATLRGQHTYCVPFTTNTGPEYRWPSQAHLNADQWWADLLTEPELLPAVLERLTDAQRATIRYQVATIAEETR
jgi:hypothetical protein